MKYFDQFKELSKFLSSFTPQNNENSTSRIDINNWTPYSPDIEDLASLHESILKRKVLNILEFGVGYSTIIMAHALMINKNRYEQEVRSNIRTSNVFRLLTIDNSKYFIRRTKKVCPSNLKSIIDFKYSRVKMATFNGKICTEYTKLPRISPCFVYIDGPSQFRVRGKISGYTTGFPDSKPMMSDVLRLEHFFEPGTLIMIDGRTANARFIASNLQRNWVYTHKIETDQHSLELIENPLGKWDKKKKEFQDRNMST